MIITLTKEQAMELVELKRKHTKIKSIEVKLNKIYVKVEKFGRGSNTLFVCEEYEEHNGKIAYNMFKDICINEKFPGVLLFNSHDQEMIQTLANRIIEITPGGIMDRKTTLEEYLENKDIQAQLKKMYDVQNA